MNACLADVLEADFQIGQQGSMLVEQAFLAAHSDALACRTVSKLSFGFEGISFAEMT